VLQAQPYLRWRHFRRSHRPTARPRPGARAVAQVDEIIVTATRREQALSDVPLAISAVGAQALRNSGATDVRALNQLNPSLLISSTGSESNTSARIRGVGTVGDNAGLESSVAIFIDGVYRSRTGVGLNELGEIERVEVLRGPQGTLFGRNASAGLLHIITKKPQFDPTPMASSRSATIAIGASRAASPDRSPPPWPARSRASSKSAAASTPTSTPAPTSTTATATSCAASCCGSRPTPSRPA
jgi:outer membrane receptor protein involved in Fe transport